MKLRLTALLAALAAALVAATTSGGATGPDHVTIAYQPGMGYAPLIIMRAQHTLENQYPNTKFDWKVLASGAAVTNGVISGDIQLGAGGIGPFLLGWAKNLNWKLIAPLNWGDLWLMAKDPNIKTIADLKGKRVAMPSPTSIQGFVLRKMAQAKLGDAHALDAGMVSMDHPDGMQALLTGQVDAHLTSLPYQMQEKIAGAHVVGRSYQYFGASSFLGVSAQQSFYDQNTAFCKQFYADVANAIKLIKANPIKVAHILQDDAGGQPSWRQFKQWMGSPSITYTTRPLGLVRFAHFMNTIGAINKMPASWKDLVFPPVYPTKGS
ncbi:MAG TPA: ABC transporter substrate-binding protein [Gaiellaceae bacterium]|nr:ABC transporter substrate-binding protein [Gaiellaceae bacterium]